MDLPCEICFEVKEHMGCGNPEGTDSLGACQGRLAKLGRNAKHVCGVGYICRLVSDNTPYSI